MNRFGDLKKVSKVERDAGDGTPSSSASNVLGVRV
jgi:hypothetical protein